MKIVKQSFEILSDISDGGLKELKQIERVARVCYKSENKITEDGSSAKKLVSFLIKQGHEAMLEHSQLSVLFTCDRAIANELVRHRIASFAQESTRYCNYAGNRFGGEITVIQPDYLEEGSFDWLSWIYVCKECDHEYAMAIKEKHMRPEQARCLLPLSLKTDIVVTANYREWRNIFKLRCDKAAHPQMRVLMTSLLTELQDKIPVIFDDLLFDEVQANAEVNNETGNV
jgi:thymidylate synthase (FAD)